MPRRRASLDGSNETGTDPNGGSTERERHGETTAVKDTASGDNLDLLAGEGRLVALDDVDDWKEAGGSANSKSIGQARATYREGSKSR